MKVLGYIFVVLGVLLLPTIIFAPLGFMLIGLGALLLIASALLARNRARREAEGDVGNVSGSMFGR